MIITQPSAAPALPSKLLQNTSNLEGKHAGIPTISTVSSDRRHQVLKIVLAGRYGQRN